MSHGMKALGVLVVLASGGCSGCEGDPERPSPPIFAGHDAFVCADGGRCEGVFPWREEPDNRAAVLRSGADALVARLQSLRDARRSIRVQALIFRADESGLAVSELLKAKRKAGVAVTVIVDALSNLDWQTQWMYFDLKQHGIEVEGYEALYLQWLTADLKPQDPLRPNKRFHDKLWIVDAEEPEHARAIIGGRNIANEYFRLGTEPIHRWRDEDVVVAGPIIADITAAFDRNFDYFKDLKARLPPVFNPDNCWRLTRAVLDKMGSVRYPFWRDARIVEQIDALAGTDAALEWRPFRGRFLQSRPRFDEDYIAQGYNALIDGAQQEILIANAYFVPSAAMIERLKAAARRGVRVTIITNSPESNDIAPVSTLSRWLYRKLLDVEREDPAPAGTITIHEWLGPQAQEGTLHAKYAVFDGVRAIVGSYNLDPRSERLNSETALAAHGEALARELRERFLQRDLPRARTIGYDEAHGFRRPDAPDELFELVYALPLRSWL